MAAHQYQIICKLEAVEVEQGEGEATHSREVGEVVGRCMPIVAEWQGGAEGVAVLIFPPAVGVEEEGLEEGLH